ncbi:MAG: pilus assembly protein TadG-related protein [Candidatus Sericytochromatia bacterium]|nr:pilus assembly protein TadG-related protein [Candidatus Sericytochromatia bacterium]
MKRFHPRGQALPLLALAATGLMLASALAWEAGSLWQARSKLQNAADAAALAGAAGLARTTGVARREAEVMAGLNGAPPPRIRMMGPSRVEVTCTQERPLAWTGAWGWATASVSARAVGELHCLRPEAGLRPWGITRQEAQPGREIVLARPWGLAAMPLVLDGPGAEAHARAVTLGARETVRVGDKVTRESAHVGPAAAAAAARLLEAGAASGSGTEWLVAVLSDPSGDDAPAVREVVGFVSVRLTRATAAGEIRARVLAWQEAKRVEGSGTRFAVRLVA